MRGCVHRHIPSFLSFRSQGVCLVRSFEFLKETGIVLREHTEVGDTVLQVGDALYTHTEGIA